MRLFTKLYLSFGLLFIITIGGGAIAVWSTRDVAVHLERSNASHRLLAAYLTLSAHAYGFFRHLGDGILLSDPDLARADLPAAIRRDLTEIREIAALKISLLGEQERVELNRLALIEKRIDRHVAEYRVIVKEKGSDRGQLVERMWDGIDKGFTPLVRRAIDEERGTTRETAARAAIHVRYIEIATGIFALLFVLAMAIILWRLLRDLRQPISNLLEGTSALTAGRLDHRIDLVGPPELTEVAEAFNRMAETVAEQQARTSRANIDLENAVADRTTDLERLLATLRESDANRRRMLAEVSHELRTPLTIIRGEADIALRGGPKPAEIYREALEKSRDAALHTTRLVDDLLLVARREAGEIRLKLEAADLVTLLPAIAEEYRSLTDQVGFPVAFETDLARADLEIDVGRIRQVIVILISNAVQYGGEQIEMRLARSPSGYSVSVSDDGPGMSEDEQGRAFERFYRGANAAARYAGGAGLGLPVARAIVEAHGGKIGLHGQEGKGVAATFTLPAR